tara:strand:+ start:753 stop:1040 length:288 start_codon:yes stop_codon:yes gene_type:complete
MKYVVTSVWKHPAALDWQQMRQNMSQFKGNPHVAEIHWYEIDETTHGSVAIYHSKEAYEANLAAQEQNRAKSTSEYSIQMLHEAHGECHSELSSL